MTAARKPPAASAPAADGEFTMTDEQIEFWTPLIVRSLEVMNLVEDSAQQMIQADIMRCQDKNSEFYKKAMEDSSRFFNQADKEHGSGNGIWTQKAWWEYR